MPRNALTPQFEMITARDLTIVISLLLLVAGLMVPTISLGRIPATYLLKWREARAWEPVPATVTYAKLAVFEDDDRTTHKAETRYTYQWLEQTYRGRNVSFSTGSDSVGAFQQQAYRILKEHLDSKTSITVWVNPDTPGESVVFRQMRLDWFSRTAAVALVPFILVAGILIFLCWYLTSRIKSQKHKM